MMIKPKRKLLIPFLVIVLCVVACFAYLGDYYHADSEAISAFKTVRDVKPEVSDDGTITYSAENPVAGFIFYPGGKVEYTAYEPLMKKCAEKGIMCVLLEMPFNLAVFDVDAAQGICDKYPEISEWYIGGHSLGGSMAASFLSGNSDKYEGLILLGSYSATDLSHTELKVLSVFGSEDKVLNKEKYEQNKANLPESFTEVVIDGGSHALFGMYGMQQGDGTASITNEEQIIFTANEIEKFVLSD